MEDTTLTTHEARLARIEAMLEALNQRLDDAVLTQLRDHGKRIRELEEQVSEIRRVCAAERGRQDGSKAMLVLILTATGSFGGILGGVLSKIF